ncbi:hypothetical protein DVH05_002783 [Phytophthora capsici]|nr:hypothetical protein DVH05_002783 [Phytophthora capsici]
MRRPGVKEDTLRQKNGVDGDKSESPVSLTTTSREQDVKETVEQMRRDVGERDGERATIYVATVRPAMSTTRYRCIRLETSETKRENKANSDSTRSVNGLVIKEPTVVSPTKVNRAGIHKVSNAEVIHTEPTGVSESGEGGDPDEDSKDGGGGYNAGEGAEATEPDGEDRALRRRRVTAERRTKRRAARRIARQRRQDQALAQKDVKLRKKTKLDQRTEERRKIADQALQALTDRLHQQEVTPPETADSDKKPSVRVKLVKQVRASSRSTTEKDTNDESYVSSADGLPTAKVQVERVWRDIKLDSCAQYTVAGTEWMQHGDRLNVKAPVDYVEGIGGFLLDVVGVWRFRFRTVFGETVCVDACIVKGCDDDFLLGVDFLRKHGANLDFERNELTYREKERRVIIPFRTDAVTEGERVNARVAAVRMTRRTQLTGNAVTPVEVSVAAPDGELGMFVPTRCAGAVMLASTVTRASNGKAIVPMINSVPGKTRLPSKKELGVWIPISEDMEVLEINGELERDRVKKLVGWIEQPRATYK